MPNDAIFRRAFLSC